jgi:hypothetical protein
MLRFFIGHNKFRFFICFFNRLLYMFGEYIDLLNGFFA